MSQNATAQHQATGVADQPQAAPATPAPQPPHRSTVPNRALYAFAAASCGALAIAGLAPQSNLPAGFGVSHVLSNLLSGGSVRENGYSLTLPYVLQGLVLVGAALLAGVLLLASFASVTARRGLLRVSGLLGALSFAAAAFAVEEIHGQALRFVMARWGLYGVGAAGFVLAASAGALIGASRRERI